MWAEGDVFKALLYLKRFGFSVKLIKVWVACVSTQFMNMTPPNPQNPTGSAVQQLKNGFFPGEWSLVPVDSNKATYLSKWNQSVLTEGELIQRYESSYHMRPDQAFKYPGASKYSGLGVLTGGLSEGLIAIDIDGELADQRWKSFLGENYEAHGAESTMSWWSGTPGRRQILYQLPLSIAPSLDNLKTVIFKEDGTWAEGQGDVGRSKHDSKDKYEEVVIRYRDCLSVLPGSVHPSGRTYEWLNYNDGNPAEAPIWLLEHLEQFRKATSGWNIFVESRADNDNWASLPANSRARAFKEAYAWWNRPEVQKKLAENMKEVIFNHPTFDEYGWIDRNGDIPHFTSGCPIHGGESGTSFSINADLKSDKVGLWHCWGCAARGNMFSFALKKHLNDWDAEPAQHKSRVFDVMQPIAEALGYDLAEEIKEEKKLFVEVATTKRKLPNEWFAAIKKIVDEERNPGIKFKLLADLALTEGYRYTGTQVEAQYIEYAYAEATEKLNNDPTWYTQLKGMEYVIPHLLRTPSQTILHSAGGVGKSATAIALARAVGRGEPMRIKGMDVEIPKGKVLYINSDQSDEKLYQDLMDNGFTHEDFSWFILKRNWQLTQTMVLRDWIRELKPALVIIDSIGSCTSRSTVSEIEKAFANPLYWISETNGSPSEEGFPATAIVHLHHDNANGQARGNRYIINAIDEQWHLRHPVDDAERSRLQNSGFNPFATRILDIKKSRQGREGDCLLVERDVDYRYAMHDWTPTVYNPPAAADENTAQADPEPIDVVLDIVNQITQKQRSESDKPKLGVTAAVVFEELSERMLGWSSGRLPAKKSVIRWLNRWVDKKLLHSEKRKTSKGVVKYYVSRALPLRNRSLSSLFNNSSQTQGSEVGTNNDPESVVLTPVHEMGSPTPETGGEDTSNEADSCPHPEMQSTTEVSQWVSTEDTFRLTTRTSDDDDLLADEGFEPDLGGF